jgi:hypothetical protein
MDRDLAERVDEKREWKDATSSSDGAGRAVGLES